MRSGRHPPFSSARFILLSVLGHTTIGKQLASVPVAAILGGEEHSHLSHIIRCANSTERHVSNGARLLFGGHQHRKSGRLNVTGAQDIDSAAATFKSIDRSAGERADSRLARVVDREGLESLD